MKALLQTKQVCVVFKILVCVTLITLVSCSLVQLVWLRSLRWTFTLFSVFMSIFYGQKWRQGDSWPRLRPTRSRPLPYFFFLRIHLFRASRSIDVGLSVSYPCKVIPLSDEVGLWDDQESKTWSELFCSCNRNPFWTLRIVKVDNVIEPDPVNTNPASGEHMYVNRSSGDRDSSLWIVTNLVVHCSFFSMFKPSPYSPTCQTCRHTKLLVHENVFRQQCPSSVEESCFLCTNSFVRLIDWPVKEERGSLYVICMPKKSNVYQPPCTELIRACPFTLQYAWAELKFKTEDLPMMF